MSFQLRDYQRSAADAAMESWKSFSRILGVAPTGSGKTIIFADIADRLKTDSRILILAHRDELITQACARLYDARGICAAREKAFDHADLDAAVVVGSVQTLARESRLGRFPSDHFQHLIVDEAHHSLADSYQRILTHFGGAKILGVTATPDRGDARDLARFFESIAFEISLVDLIKAGHLSRIKVQTVPVKIDIADVSTRTGDYAEEEVAGALEPLLEPLAEAIATYAKGRKTLIFVPLIRVAIQFADILCRHGFEAEMICGTCSDRSEKLDRFRNGETDVLVNASLLNEGYDEPSVDCVVCLRPTRIRSLFAQMVGRGTRTHPGKDHLLLLDFLWQSRRYDLVKPASLVCHDQTEQQQVEEVLGEGGDLVRAMELSRERALARLVLAQRARKAELVDLLDLEALCVAYEAPELTRYSPTMYWHRLPITDKQRAILHRLKADVRTVRNRGHASEIISASNRFFERQPATEKQIRYLLCLGYQGTTDSLSKPGASRLIGELKQKNQQEAACV
jgi:superfamily II DNA or RNA helicase